jgi:ABC-type branched-subunit amino acid transport system ATPase component
MQSLSVGPERGHNGSWPNQKADLALSFAENAVVLDRGRAVFCGKSAELHEDEAPQYRLLAVGGR